MELVEKLSLYLPYKLRIQHGEDNKLMNLGEGSSNHWIGMKSVIKWSQSEMIVKPKPIVLHPEDMNEREMMHSRFYFSLSSLKDGKNVSAIRFDVLIWLLKNHVWLWPEDFEKGIVVRKQLKS